MRGTVTVKVDRANTDPLRSMEKAHSPRGPHFVLPSVDYQGTSVQDSATARVPDTDSQASMIARLPEGADYRPEVRTRDRLIPKGGAVTKGCEIENGHLNAGISAEK